MTAAYLKSDFQKVLEQQLAAVDSKSAAFLDSAPLVIDCRDDGEAFRARLSSIQREAIEASHARGELAAVSNLAQPARLYACDKLRERFALLDDDVRERVRVLLKEWRTGRAILAGAPDWRGGIDLVLPVSGIPLPYNVSDLLPFS